MGKSRARRSYFVIIRNIRARYFVAVVFFVLICAWLAARPSHDRNWTRDQAVLPQAVVDGKLIHIKNIRNFSYRSTTDYAPAYYDKTYDVNKLTSAWYIVEPFSGLEGSAHTFVSFGFEGDEYVAISIEIRKEVGETFSAWKGLLKQYEIMYVIGDERDVVGLRANHRHDDVYVYPIKTTPERMQQVFLSMIDRVNELYEQPEFYNTLTNTCTTNLVAHVNDIFPGRIPLSYKVLFPGYSDQLAYDGGVIDTTLPFEQIRAKYRINGLAATYADATDFSVKIRQHP